MGMITLFQLDVLTENRVTEDTSHLRDEQYG